MCEAPCLRTAPGAGLLDDRLARGLPVAPPDGPAPGRQAGEDPEKIAKEDEKSEQMARFRLNASGVFVQVGRAKAARQKQARLSG